MQLIALDGMIMMSLEFPKSHGLYTILTLSLPVTHICVNFSTVYNDMRTHVCLKGGVQLFRGVAASSAAFVLRLRGQSLCRSSYHWFCLALTTAMPHSPASRIGWWTDCGPCSTRLRGWSTLPVEPSTWHRSSVICTGFVIPIGSTTSWRCWSTDASMDWCRATSPTNSRACRRLCLDGIFGRLWRPVLLCLAFSGRHSAVVHSLWQRLKHGTAYRHMSHHLHRWHLSSAAFKTELFLRSYAEAWYRLMLHVTFLTLLHALEVNIDLRHVNHIRYYYYYMLVAKGLKSG